MTAMTESFPRQQARTRHFTLGLPRSFQISPDGNRVAFLRSRGGDDPVTCLWVLDTGTGAECLVAEEMGRTRGHWWAPDGTAVLVARVDEKPVQRWHIADPANPGRAPAEVAYPAAGTPNADVSLVLAGLDGTTVPVEWDRARFPYLVTVTWEAAGALLVVQSRDQRRTRLLSADPVCGEVELIREDNDEHWVDIVAGVPGWTGDGRIVWAADSGGAKRLLVAAPEALAEGTAAPVTPPGLQVRAVADVDGDAVLFTASDGDPTGVALWLYREDGPARLTPEHG